MTDADQAWLDALEAERAWREAHYTDHGSPLSMSARRRFRGLDWYDPDPAFRLQDLKLQRHPSPKEANLAATGDDAVRFLEVGIFSFELQGTACMLAVFEPAPGEVDEAYLFIPFQDATSGKATYGAGRYIDLEPNDEDVYELDLNTAYHPYCAFDDAWACTLPPPGNRLPVAVEAGERLQPPPTDA